MQYQQDTLFSAFISILRQMRTLGKILKFRSQTPDFLIGQKASIVAALKEHGVICIPGANFNPKQMVQFTGGIFDDMITLPEKMAFMNQQKQYPQVSRIGNVLLDGSLKDTSKEAIIYHSDGNFWGENKKVIFNVLHSKEQPQQGGDTHFIDLVQAAKFIKEKKPKIYNTLKESVGILDFNRISDFHLYGTPELQNQAKFTRHRVINKYNFNGKQIAYLSIHMLQNEKTGQPVTDIQPRQIVEYLHNEMGYYAHKWKHGDILIWDNVQTLHRSAGAFKGRRLIYKCHGKFNTEGKTLLESTQAV